MKGNGMDKKTGAKKRVCMKMEKDEALKITGHTQMHKNLSEEENRGQSQKYGRMKGEDNRTRVTSEVREEER